MNNLTIITNYYPPESGAAANRIETMAIDFNRKDLNVTVICPIPNYPTGRIFKDYKNLFYAKEIRNQISVKRLWIFPSNSKNKIVRMFSMLSFSFSLVIYLLFFKTSKKIIIQSPPLLVSFFAILLSKIKQKKIILNVSDLWPMAGKDLGIMTDSFGYKILEKIEYFNYKNSSLILGQSNEILEHISKICDTKNILYRNFPRIKTPDLFENNEPTITIIYAGLLGVAQGILNICQNIKLPKNTVLHIYGNGAEKEKIEQYLLENQNNNIKYYGEIERKNLHEILIKKADYALVPLINRIYGSVPSKIFEMAHLGLPILYMGGGEGNTIIKHYNLGHIIEINDFETLNNTIQKLSKTTLDRKAKILAIAQNNFIQEFQFEKIFEKIKTL